MRADILASGAAAQIAASSSSSPARSDAPSSECPSAAVVRSSLDPGDSSTPPILKLPAELIIWTAEYASLIPGALLSLRATCRELHAMTKKLVVEKYFTDRAFLIKHPGSLLALYEISQLPICKSMKHIRFSLVNVLFHDNHKHILNLRYLLQSGEAPERPAEAPKRPDLWESFSEFYSTGHAFPLLRETLVNFRKNGVHLAISLTADRARGDEPGYRQLCAALDHLDCACPDYRDGLNVEPFALLRRAIEAADYPVSHLEIDTGNKGPDTSLSNLDTGYELVPPGSYGHLRTLRLSFCPIQLAPWDSGAWSAFQHVFSQLVGLQQLSLSRRTVDPSSVPERFKAAEYRFLLNKSYQSKDAHDEITSAFVSVARDHAGPYGTALRRLDKLELTGFWLDLDELRDIVWATRRTLETLEIRCLRSITTLPDDFEEILLKVHGSSDFDLRVSRQEAWW